MKRNGTLSALIALASVGTLAAITLAQPPRPPFVPTGGTAPRTLPDLRPTPPPGAKDMPTGPNDSSVYPQGDLMTQRGDVYTLQGNARALYKETVFQSDTVLWNEKTQIASAPGKLQIDDKQNSIVGDRGEALYKVGEAVITGNVTIVARPKPEDLTGGKTGPRKEFKKPVTITCNRVRYNWRKRVGIPTGDITIRCAIRDRDWTFTCDEMTYYAKDETVTLRGNIVGTNTRGEKWVSDAVTIVLTDGAPQPFTAFKVKNPSQFKVEEDGGDETPVSAPPLDQPPPGTPTPTPPADRP
jgi:lipopolysaccharide export system protein LptA